MASPREQEIITLRSDLDREVLNLVKRGDTALQIAEKLAEVAQ